MTDATKAKKRNEFQKAEDRKLAIDMLQAGHSLIEIAAHISEIRPYTLSHQQVSADTNKLRLAAIASTQEHMLVTIDLELQEIEKTLEQAWAAIDAPRELIEVRETGTTAKAGDYERVKEQWINTVPSIAAMKVVLDAIARRSTLMGVDAYLKHLDINAAIETLTAKGYEISIPEEKSES
jgi:hypothetical protein